MLPREGQAMPPCAPPIARCVGLGSAGNACVSASQCHRASDSWPRHHAVNPRYFSGTHVFTPPANAGSVRLACLRCDRPVDVRADGLAVAHRFRDRSADDRLGCHGRHGTLLSWSRAYGVDAGGVRPRRESRRHANGGLRLLQLHGTPSRGRNGACHLDAAARAAGCCRAGRVALAGAIRAVALRRRAPRPSDRDLS